MTDQSGREPEQRLPARRPPSEVSPADRFTAPASAHPPELSPERAAKIVSQSASARWIGFLVVCVVILFFTVYYFYEVGAPLGLTTPRLDAQAEVQQVTAIERGYNLYQANCARCHGPDGEGTTGGYIGPVLHDQAKLFDHLNARYIQNVLTVGGRYVCGNPLSAMPVWADTNGGPLNYRQIQELIAFLRAPSTQEFVQRNPELNEPVIGEDGKVKTFRGWVDPSFKPDPSATPVPACWAGSGGPAPSASIDPNLPVVTIVATTAKSFDTPSVTVAAGTPFTLEFDNQDATNLHNVVVNDPNGDAVDIGDNPFFIGPEKRSYNYPALDAGAYPFFCQVHPTTMTGTLTVE
jgi:mono/diheme cytochrome c family protein/plastocyanin